MSRERSYVHVPRTSLTYSVVAVFLLGVWFPTRSAVTWVAAWLCMCVAQWVLIDEGRHP